MLTLVQFAVIVAEKGQECVAAHAVQKDLVDV